MFHARPVVVVVVVVVLAQRKQTSGRRSLARPDMRLPGRAAEKRARLSRFVISRADERERSGASERAMVKYIWWLSTKEEAEVRKRLERQPQKQPWLVLCSQEHAQTGAARAGVPGYRSDFAVVTSSEFPNDSFIVTQESVVQLTTTASDEVLGESEVPVFQDIEAVQSTLLKTALHNERQAVYRVSGISARLHNTDFVVRLGTVTMNGNPLPEPARAILEVDYPLCADVCANAAITKEFLDSTFCSFVSLPLTVLALASSSQQVAAAMQTMPVFSSALQLRDVLYDMLRAAGRLWWPKSLPLSRYTPLHAAATYATWLPRYQYAAMLPRNVYLAQHQAIRAQAQAQAQAQALQGKGTRG